MIYLIIFIVLTVIVLWQLFHQEKLANNTVIAFVGTMGSGKTYKAVAAARSAYKKQKLKRFMTIICPPLGWLLPKWKYKPTLYSNIPIRIRMFGKRQFSYVFRKEHILRQKLLPLGAIVVIDEIGQFASQWDYDNPYVKEQFADFTRFFRHWVDGRMYVTDQSSDNIVKAVRSRLGLIYHLNNFRRWYLLPFYKVDVTPLLMVEDSKQELSVEVDRRSYFFGMLHYMWFQRLLKLEKYNSRCYSEIYKYGATRVPEPFDKSLKTRYLIDISVSKNVSRDYKENRDRYKAALFSPAAKPPEKEE